MNLLIISNMEHYRDGDSIWGWGPTVQEINHLATLFNDVRHVGCLHNGSPTGSSLPYTKSNINFVPLPPAGGKTLKDKLEILRFVPIYLKTIWSEFQSADVVHVRCPANIPLLAILLLSLVRRPTVRWVKYAGNWQGYEKEPLTYRFQRWWLNKGFSRSQVTINGEWPCQPPHVVSFFNPCLTEQELDEGRSSALCKNAEGPFRLLFVGALNEDKGVGRAIKVMQRLRDEGLDITLDLVGDSPDRSRFEQMTVELGLQDVVVFHGWVKRTELPPYFIKAHCLLLPSKSEGWPKVLSEAMAYGALPIAGAVSAIPQYLDQFKVGKVVVFDDIEKYVQAIKEYSCDRELWQKESSASLQAARLFSYEEYLHAVRKLLSMRAL